MLLDSFIIVFIVVIVVVIIGVILVFIVVVVVILLPGLSLLHQLQVNPVDFLLHNVVVVLAIFELVVVLLQPDVVVIDRAQMPSVVVESLDFLPDEFFSVNAVFDRINPL